LPTGPPALPPHVRLLPGQLELCEGSTLQRARALLHELNTNAAVNADGPVRVGVLSFASATKPGGGFLSGAQAQEESIARASTVYASLVTPTAAQFHQATQKGPPWWFLLPRHDLLPVRPRPPRRCRRLGSAIPDRGRHKCGGQRGSRTPERWGQSWADTAARIEGAMRERMARILFLFEQRGLRNIVLGSFGTGVFRNDVGMVADIWFDLLAEDGARFAHSFDRVVFGIIDRQTVERFKAVFESRIEARDPMGRSPGMTPRSVLRVVE
jgi:hypothetical protein